VVALEIPDASIQLAVEDAIQAVRRLLPVAERAEAALDPA
jgi:hypothetical protein